MFTNTARVNGTREFQFIVTNGDYCFATVAFFFKVTTLVLLFFVVNNMFKVNLMCKNVFANKTRNGYK